MVFGCSKSTHIGSCFINTLNKANEIKQYATNSEACANHWIGGKCLLFSGEN